MHSIHLAIQPMHVLLYKIFQSPDSVHIRLIRIVGTMKRTCSLDFITEKISQQGVPGGLD